MISPQKKQIQVFIAAAGYRAKHPETTKRLAK